MKEEGDELAARERQARDDYWAEQEPLDAEVVELPADEGGYSFNKDAARFDVKAVPLSGDCDCDMGCRHPADCALLHPPDAAPIDAEVVEPGHPVALAVDVGEGGLMTVGAAQLQPDGTVHMAAASVRIKPSGRECWWRLYSTPTSFMRDHQDHGVRAVYARRDNPHMLVMDLVDHGRYEFTALAWRVNNTDPSRTGQTELVPGPGRECICDPDYRYGYDDRCRQHRHASKARPQHDLPAPTGPDSVDLLVEFPPTLPGKPRHWQQMTQPGQLRHPGDNRENWQFYDWWQGGHGVRFDEPAEPGQPNPLDGFKPLGRIDDEGAQ